MFDIFTSWAIVLEDYCVTSKIQAVIITEPTKELFHKVLSKIYIYMLFAGWEVRIVKNCDRGLKNVARGHTSVTVFHYTDRP